MTEAGIWRHAGIFADGGAPARLAERRGWTLGEGDTPMESWPELASELGLARLSVKREDLNPNHSHKDRGLLYQIAAHRAGGADRAGADPAEGVDPAGGVDRASAWLDGHAAHPTDAALPADAAPQAGAAPQADADGPERPPTAFVLSSSGNAAISAAAVCARTGDRLIAFLSPDTEPAKLAALDAAGAEVLLCDKPINYARYAARVFALTDLRGTQDPCAPTGYRSLAAEIVEAVHDVDVVVTFSSSGISLRGLLDGFAALGREVRAYAVQAGVSLGLARAAGLDADDEPECPAGRLGIRTPPDAADLVADLAATGGGVWVVRTGPLLDMATRMEGRAVHEGGALRTSAEGAAVLAAIADAGETLRGLSVVAVITGHASQWPERHGEPAPATTPRNGAPRAIADSYLAVRDRLRALGLEPA